MRAKLSDRVSLRRVVNFYRRSLSRQIYEQCGGIVQRGPFTGMRWLDSPRWGGSEKGVMLLGLYEQEVLNNFVAASSKYRTFVDVGAADGYYAVGFLINGKVERSIAFEAAEEGRKTIRRLAEKNGVLDKISILGKASDNFAKDLLSLNVVPSESMFLVDIEGAEFNVLTEDLLDFLKSSLIIVETHAHIFPDPQGMMDSLVKRASKTHRISMWTSGARNPWAIQELDTFTELDRWILCSEGRIEIQQWLRFDPIEE